MREIEENDFTEVYDEAEIASAFEMSFTAQKLKEFQEKNKPETHPDFDGKHCIDCDGEIIKERLALNKIRCVTCQEIIEKRRKQYGN